MSTGESTGVSRSWKHAAGILAVVVVAYAGFIRTYDLDENPPGFWQDEMSTALDAYLIWNTGRDYEGQSLPIYSKALGEYGLTLNRYIHAPFVGLLGQTPGIQRLPTALTGILFVLLAALLAFRLFGLSAGLGTLISAALCPMWVQFSRYSSEAIYLPFLLTLGFFLFELGRDPKRRPALWLGAASLAATAYTYHAVKVNLPIWMIGFLIYHRPLIRDLWKLGTRRHVIGPALVFTLLVLPSLVLAFSLEGQARGNNVLAWKHFEGERLAWEIVDHYLAYFEADFLFIRGGASASQSIPRFGLWSLMDLPLIVLGLVAIIRGSTSNRRAAWFFVFWFLTAPIPGALTYERNNVGRAIAWLPSPMLLSGVGFSALVAWATAGTRIRLGTVSALLSAGWVFTTMALSEAVLVTYKRDVRHNWQYEISGAMRCAIGHRRDEMIIVSPDFAFGTMFAQFLYAEIPPAKGSDHAWEQGRPTVVAPGTLYVFPARDPMPVGKELCALRYREDQAPRAYVYGAQE